MGDACICIGAVKRTVQVPAPVEDNHRHGSRCFGISKRQRVGRDAGLITRMARHPAHDAPEGARRFHCHGPWSEQFLDADSQETCQASGRIGSDWELSVEDLADEREAQARSGGELCERAGARPFPRYLHSVRNSLRHD
jgi:hypothetical protein